MTKKLSTLITLALMTAACGDSPQYSLFSFQSLNFNGSDEFLQATSVPVTGYPFSVSAWVKTSSSSAQTVWALCKSTSTTSYQELSFAASGFPRVISTNPTAAAGTSAVAFHNGNWHHLVAVFTSATSRTLYVNNVSRATNATSVTYDTGTNQMVIGRRCGSSPAEHFNGRIDEVSVWSTALSVAQVSTLYNSGKPGDISGTTGLVNWYRNGEKNGDSAASIFDVSSSNHLTNYFMESSNIVLDAP